MTVILLKNNNDNEHDTAYETEQSYANVNDNNDGHHHDEVTDHDHGTENRNYQHDNLRRL